MEQRRIKIVSDGNPNNTSVKYLDTGEDVELCYAYRVEGQRLGATDRATVWCFLPEMDVTAYGEVVEVPRSLLKKAEEVAKRWDSENVRRALSDLLGVIVLPRSAIREP